MREGRYTVEFYPPGGPESVIARNDSLKRARELYRRAVAANPDRVVLLCDGGRILARSDQPDSMPL
jgi:hypothetical protein